MGAKKRKKGNSRKNRKPRIVHRGTATPIKNEKAHSNSLSNLDSPLESSAHDVEEPLEVGAIQTNGQAEKKINGTSMHQLVVTSSKSSIAGALDETRTESNREGEK